MASTTAAAPPATTRESVTFEDVCRGCGRKVKRRSRKAMTWRCECGRTNPGPGLLEEMSKPPEGGAVRRRRRRAAAAEERAERGPEESTPSPAPAPVRRKRTAAPSGGPTSEAATRNSRPAADERPASPPPAPRRGFLSGLMYGAGDDEGDE